MYAGGHTDAEATVLKNIVAYWDARNDRDWDTVVAMSSSSGVLNTNSDGSFHTQKHSNGPKIGRIKHPVMQA